MNPGQLVYDTRLGKVVEIVSRCSERLYLTRPLGRKYISVLMPSRALWLRELAQSDLTTWHEIEARTGWRPTRSKAK